MALVLVDREHAVLPLYLAKSLMKRLERRAQNRCAPLTE